MKESRHFSFRISVVLLVLVGLILTGPFQALAKESITIGVVQPLTGWAALGGKNVVSGMKIALNKINAEGGVLGKPLKLQIEDGKADPVESVKAVEKLIRRDKVPAIIGCWASSATLATMPIVKKNKIPMLVETSTAPMITDKKNKWVFRFTSSNDFDGALMEKYLVPKLGFKKVAYLAVNNDWGRSMAKAVKEIIDKTGGWHTFEFGGEEKKMYKADIMNELITNEPYRAQIVTQVHEVL